MKIHEALISDPDRNFEKCDLLFKEMDKWSLEHCKSYIGYNVDDIADFSPSMDLLGSYKFSDEQDKFAFLLKWNK